MKNVFYSLILFTAFAFSLSSCKTAGISTDNNPDDITQNKKKGNDGTNFAGIVGKFNTTTHLINSSGFIIGSAQSYTAELRDNGKYIVRDYKQVILAKDAVPYYESKNIVVFQLPNQIIIALRESKDPTLANILKNIPVVMFDTESKKILLRATSDTSQLIGIPGTLGGGLGHMDPGVIYAYTTEELLFGSEPFNIIPNVTFKKSLAITDGENLNFPGFIGDELEITPIVKMKGTSFPTPVPFITGNLIACESIQKVLTSQ